MESEVELKQDNPDSDQPKVFRDCVNRLIQEGQFVASNQEHFTYCLRVARVTGFTKKKVKIRFQDGTETTKFGIQLAIL